MKEKCQLGTLDTGASFGLCGKPSVVRIAGTHICRKHKRILDRIVADDAKKKSRACSPSRIADESITSAA
jgi:hypothetical protein